MIDFLYLDRLWWLLLPAAFLGMELLRLRRDAARLARVADAAQLARLAPGRIPGALRALLLALGAALVILALSRPRYGEEPVDVLRGGIDLCVALDLSKSMYAQDIAPTRLERAKSELGEALSSLPVGRVCAVAFAGTADVYPLTSDRDAIRFFLRDLSPADMPTGGTALSVALLGAVKALSVDPGQEGKPRAPRALLLITDGEDTAGGDLEGAIRAAKDAGVQIFALGVGGDSPEPIPQVEDGKVVGYLDNGAARSSLKEDALRRLVEATGGRYARLSEGVSSLRAPLLDLQQGYIEAQVKSARAERFAWLLAPAALVLLLELWLSRRASAARGAR
jgi:Ca-activated chloride channel family protein